MHLFNYKSRKKQRCLRCWLCQVDLTRMSLERAYGEHSHGTLAHCFCQSRSKPKKPSTFRKAHVGHLELIPWCVVIQCRATAKGNRGQSEGNGL